MFKHYRVNYPQNFQVSIDNALFQLPNDNRYYAIEIPHKNKEKIQEMTPLLIDDEILSADDGVYTYIIGTNLLTDEVHIWYKKVHSIQEIETKHTNIVEACEQTYFKIVNGYEISETDKKYGVIDYIIYAGEIRKMTECFEINLISGSYMLNVVNSTNPCDYVVNDIVSLFYRKLKISVIIDITGKTFITESEYRMTAELLEKYVRSGANVYIFSAKQQAMKYLNRKINMAKLKARYDIALRVKNNSAQLEQLKMEMEDIDSLKPIAWTM